MGALFTALEIFNSKQHLRPLTNLCLLIITSASLCGFRDFHVFFVKYNSILILKIMLLSFRALHGHTWYITNLPYTAKQALRSSKQKLLAVAPNLWNTLLAVAVPQTPVKSSWSSWKCFFFFIQTGFWLACWNSCSISSTDFSWLISSRLCSQILYLIMCLSPPLFHLAVNLLHQLGAVCCHCFF